MLGLINQGSKDGEDGLEYWLNGNHHRPRTWSGVENDPQDLVSQSGQHRSR